MDKYFDIDEAMIDYAEMTCFDFKSDAYLQIKEDLGEYSKQTYTFKYGNYDLTDMLHSLAEGV